MTVKQRPTIALLERADSGLTTQRQTYLPKATILSSIDNGLSSPKARKSQTQVELALSLVGMFTLGTDSSALLVMKAHQQNTWKPFIFKSLDFCQAIAVPQVPKASLLQSVEFDWLGKGQKRAQGIGSEGLL